MADDAPRPDQLAAARQRLRVMFAGPERDAAATVLAALASAERAILAWKETWKREAAALADAHADAAHLREDLARAQADAQVEAAHLRADLADAHAENARLRAAMDAVREVHERDDLTDGGAICLECNGGTGAALDWPCATVRALAAAPTSTEGGPEVVEMANANRCPHYPRHRLVDQGYDPSLFGHRFVCTCGEWQLGRTDQARHARAAAPEVHTCECGHVDDEHEAFSNGAPGPCTVITDDAGECPCILFDPAPRQVGQ